jgi:hypothetical protein
MFCRICGGRTKKTGLLFKCKGKECKSVYWDKRAVLKLIRDKKEDEEYYKVILKKALIPEIKGKSFCYRLKLKNIKDTNNKDEKKYIEKNACYIGRTNLHPYARYFNHIRGHLSAKGRAQTKKRAVALIEYEGPMTYDQSIVREKEWANDLREQNVIVYQN